jgi:acyl-coenzyme A synthetase/AMP-(fatty) acid ligase
MAVAAMFACARIGAVHCVLYSVLAAKDLEIRITAGEKSHYINFVRMYAIKVPYL